jgi:hypothetical protein
MEYVLRTQRFLNGLRARGRLAALLAILIACAWSPGPAEAAPKSSGTCRIEVTTFRKSKKSSKRVFKIPAESTADCRAAAKLHEENFNPKHITRVQVKSTFTRAGESGKR